jgi:rod shape-determining protein MreC
MRYVKKRARDEIRSGNIAVTSGLRSIYPGEIPIGEVIKIEAPEWQPSLIVEIEPVIDFSRLEYVFVLQLERK